MNWLCETLYFKQNFIDTLYLYRVEKWQGWIIVDNYADQNRALVFNKQL